MTEIKACYGTAKAVPFQGADPTGISYTRNIVSTQISSTFRSVSFLMAMAAAAMLSGCREQPDVDPSYHEFAYVSNGGSDSVSVIDAQAMRNIKTIAVGKNP